MSEDIELQTVIVGGTGVRQRNSAAVVRAPSQSSIASSQSAKSSDVLLREWKQHHGAGNARVPLQGTAATAFAGQTQQKIFESHLGTAAGDPNNPIGKALDDILYPKRAARQRNEEKANKYQEEKLAQQKVLQQQPPVLVVPFSNNIGPGNQIQEAKTPADFIAQGHDQHYADARNEYEVVEADHEAISQFTHEAIQGSDPISRAQAAIGAIGLTAKVLVEKALGKTLYGKYAI